MNNRSVTKIKPMVDHDVFQSLKRAYHNMHPYQYAREIYQNALEGGAANLWISKEVQSLALGISRLVFIDDGDGIPVNDLERLLNRRNSSSKTVGTMSDNFGIGVKDAALYPNSYGLLIASYSEQYPEGGCVWLQAQGQRAGVRQLISERMIECEQEDDEEYQSLTQLDFKEIRERMEREEREAEEEGQPPLPIEFVVDGIDLLKLKDNLRSATGTLVILFGESPEQNTYALHANPARLFLSKRYEQFSLQVRQLEATPSKSWAHQMRKVPAWFDFGNSSHKVMSSTLYYGAVEILIYLKPIEWLLRAEKPHFMFAKYTRIFFCALSLNGELYEQEERSGWRNARLWGLHWSKTAKRTCIVVRLPAQVGDQPGAYTNSERSEVKYGDPRNGTQGEKVDLTLVQEYVSNNLPDFILEAMSKESQENKVEAGPNKTLERYKGYFKAMVRRGKTIGRAFMRDEDGDILGASISSEGDGDGESEGTREAGTETKSPYDVDGEGQLPAKRKRKPAKKQVTDVRWKSQDADFLGDCLQFAYPAKYIPQTRVTAPVLWLNSNHQIFADADRVVEDWLRRNSHEYHSGDIRTFFVEPLWAEQATCFIEHLRSATGEAADPARFDKERLAAHFYGCYHVDQTYTLKRLYERYQKSKSVEVAS